jgi:hypothetical protein
VFLATLPVTIPFMVMHSAAPAMRVSNGIAIGMLFVLGYTFGRTVGRNPWLHALWMVVLGGCWLLSPSRWGDSGMRNCFVIAGAALTLLAVHVQAQTAEPQGPQPLRACP